MVFRRRHLVNDCYSETLVADGSLMLKLNPGFVTSRRSAFSYGVDQMEYYHASLGNAREAHVFTEKIEGARFVDTIRWILGRVKVTPMIS